MLVSGRVQILSSLGFFSPSDFIYCRWVFRLESRRSLCRLEVVSVWYSSKSLLKSKTAVFFKPKSRDPILTCYCPFWRKSSFSGANSQFQALWRVSQGPSMSDSRWNRCALPGVTAGRNLPTPVASSRWDAGAEPGHSLALWCPLIQDRNIGMNEVSTRFIYRYIPIV